MCKYNIVIFSDIGLTLQSKEVLKTFITYITV